MTKVLYYEWIKAVVQDCIDDKTEDECITDGANACAFSQEESQYWMDIFNQYVPRHRNMEETFENAKYLIQKAHASEENGGLGHTVDEICDLFIVLITRYWENAEEVVIYRNGQRYRKISGYQIDLSEPPTGIQTVHFANTSFNENNGNKEVYIQINKWTYKMAWDYVPDIWKTLYYAWLKFQNIPIPIYLTDYATATINLENLWIDFNLDNAELIN